MSIDLGKSDFLRFRCGILSLGFLILPVVNGLQRPGQLSHELAFKSPAVRCGRAPGSGPGVWRCRRICTVIDPDTGRQLASGRYIVQHRQIPSTDVLSYTARDRAVGFQQEALSYDPSNPQRWKALADLYAAQGRAELEQYARQRAQSLSQLKP